MLFSVNKKNLGAMWESRVVPRGVLLDDVLPGKISQPCLFVREGFGPILFLFRGEEWFCFSDLAGRTFLPVLESTQNCSICGDYGLEIWTLSKKNEKVKVTYVILRVGHTHFYNFKF
jgi:hypothetical protein